MECSFVLLKDLKGTSPVTEGGITKWECYAYALTTYLICESIQLTKVFFVN
jgi:hypothetical protein